MDRGARDIIRSKKCKVNQFGNQKILFDMVILDYNSG